MRGRGGRIRAGEGEGEAAEMGAGMAPVGRRRHHEGLVIDATGVGAPTGRGLLRGDLREAGPSCARPQPPFYVFLMFQIILFILNLGNVDVLMFLSYFQCLFGFFWGLNSRP